MKSKKNVIILQSRKRMPVSSSFTSGEWRITLLKQGALCTCKVSKIFCKKQFFFLVIFGRPFYVFTWNRPTKHNSKIETKMFPRKSTLIYFLFPSGIYLFKSKSTKKTRTKREVPEEYSEHCQTSDEVFCENT